MISGAIQSTCSMCRTSIRAEPEIFQGRGGVVESGHFNKSFVRKKTQEKKPSREKFGSFFS